MGLIAAAWNAAGGTLASQWKEYFYCDAMEADVLVTKGQMRKSGKFGTSNKGNDNIISNGSGIAVADVRTTTSFRTAASSPWPTASA